MSNASKKSTFFGGAAVLAISAVLVKVIGAIYKIPLSNVLTDAAYADFSGAYNIYNFFLTISTAGLPVALSKAISESEALGRYNQAQKVFRVASATFLIMGIFSFLCMSALAVPVSNVVINNPKAVYCVMALSPSVLCVCIMSALRGYFQGRFNMVPTGVSQVIESFFKLVVGLALAVMILNMAIQPPDLGERLPAVGAILGVSAGSVVALGYLAVVFSKAKKQRIKGTDKADGSKKILADLMKIAIPITIGSASTAIVTLIDGNLVMGQLQHVYQTVQGMGEIAALDAARSLKGVYDKCMAIYNLPFSMMIPLTACIVPAVSACLAKRDGLGAQRISESSLRVGLLLALPMGMGLFALGGPIMGLLVKDVNVAVAGPLLSVLGLASVAVSVQLLCNAILQANGMVNLPILAVVIGGIVKIVVNYTLVGNPDILINGAPVGTLCCFLVIDVIEIFIIRRSVPSPPSFTKALGKPLIASVIMAGAAWGVYGLLERFLFSLPRFQRVAEGTGEVVFSYMGNALATVAAIGVGGVTYLILVLALRTISREDLALMPKGEKIARILHIK